MCCSCRTVPSTMEAMTRAKILSSCAALLLGATGLAGCSADTDDDAPPQAASPRDPSSSESPEAGDGSDVPVIQPGLPGEPAATGGDVTTEEPAEWNHSDIAFVQMMIPHHAQALEMSRLAPKRAENPQVRRLAERIEAAQAPEILLMASWLEEQNLDVPSASDDPLDYDHGAHGHDGMEGMLTPQELKELAAAEGSRVRPALPDLDDPAPRRCADDGRPGGRRRQRAAGARAGRRRRVQPGRGDRPDAGAARRASEPAGRG